MQVNLTLKFVFASKSLFNSEIIFIMEICHFSSKQNINYQIKFTLKVHFLLSSYQLLFYPGDEICDWGNCPLGKCLFGEFSVRDIVRSRNVFRGKVRRGNVQIPLELQNINKDLQTYFTEYKAKKDDEVIKKHDHFMFYKRYYFL